MRVIIAGSRGIVNYNALLQAIQDSGFEITTVISGGARGADRLGERFARENKIPLHIYAANWELHGRAAGYIRNKEMVDNADALICLWDGESRGSKHTIEIANSKGLHVHIHYVKTPNTLMKGT